MIENKDIIILMPTYDDWQSVFVLLDRLDQELSANSLSAKVVVVDDGSPVFADPKAFANLSFKAIPQVRVITLNRNMGNQKAIAVAIGYISDKMQGDFLVVMDSDLEDDPKYVPQLVAAAREADNNIIFAERTVRSEGAVFRMAYSIYRYLFRLLTGMTISVGNFSVIPGRLIKRVASISEIWSHFPSGIMRARVPFSMLPTVRGTRVHGSSGMNTVHLVIHALSGFAVHADVVGVRIIISIFLFGTLTLVALLALIAKRFLFDFFVLGWTSLSVMILGIAVVQAFIAAVFMAFMILSGENNS